MAHDCKYILRDRLESRGIYLGTASDRYGGWQGQIYHKEYKVTRRPKKLKSQTFTEEVLPVECVSEFFEHLDFVEIDFTFYNYLLDEKGKPTPTYKTLEAYARNLPEGAQVTLKVPQLLTAHRLYRSGQAVDNEGRHDPQAFADRFHGPAQELLGDKVAAFIFEHEYKRKAERPEAAAYVEDQAKFFGALPKDGRYHVEERTESLKTDAYWSWLRHAGIGNVLSHWTYLPKLSEQFSKQQKGWEKNPSPLRGEGREGGEKRGEGKEQTPSPLRGEGREGSGLQIIRLLTPLGTRYEDAYASFHPFDKLKEPPTAMIQETIRMVEVLTKDGIKVFVTANNRAGGNAPEILREIAEGLAS